MEQKLWVISVGGSVVFPDRIDYEFLKSFRRVILDHIKKGNRFALVVGGGKLGRLYQEAASHVVKIDKEDLDWLGIHATRINAHLLRTIFRDIAHRRVIKNPNEPFRFSEQVMIAAGWRPGWSTDYIAVLLAKRFDARQIINMSNIDYVYTSDPKLNPGSKPVKEISWQDYRNLIGSRWEPGMNVPFDPVASREAQKLGLKVYFINGRNLQNLEDILNNRAFRGTILG